MAGPRVLRGRGGLGAGAAAFLLLLVGCRQAPSGGTPAGGANAGRGSSQAAPVPENPRDATFQRVDLLIAQWDAGQSEGRTEQMDELSGRIRQEVDGAFAEFAAAARGTYGLRLEYLGTIALGFSSRPEATPLLVERLAGDDPQLVGNALIAIKMRADPNTPLPPILQRIPATAGEPRRYAPLALANVLEARQRVGPPVDAATQRSALNLLSSVVADRDPYVRLHVAKALGFLPQPGAYELVLILLRDEHARIRVAAAAALERLGDPRGFPEVVQFLKDAPEEIKPTVRDILGSYAGRLQGRALPDAEVCALGVSPLAWQRWWQEYTQRTGSSGVASAPPPASAPPGPTGLPGPRPLPPTASVPYPAPAPPPGRAVPVAPAPPPPPRVSTPHPR